MKRRMSIALLCCSMALGNALVSMPVKASDPIEGTDPYTAVDFESYLTEQGFPESYKIELRRLHEVYPNWIFEAQHTGLEWAEALQAESIIGKNLVPASSISSWKSTDDQAYDWDTGEWAEFDSGGWVAASPEIIGYYMDPRNFLGEDSVFQFLKQSYDPQTETKEGIENMTADSFLAGTYEENGTQSYSAALIQAAEVSNVNPYVLASMIIMEQGRDGTGDSISGTVAGYEGYYNYFNIGAYKTASMSAVERGLWFAKGSGAGAVSYDRPWDARIKSILGGALHYGENYVNKGQDTLYLKKFNVQGDNLYNHQYMANVAGSASEGSIMSEAYTAAFRTGNLTFKIPVYENMPETACVQPTGNEPPVREDQTKPEGEKNPDGETSGNGSAEENNPNTGNDGKENINGNIALTDGEAKVGDTVSVKAVVSSEEALISKYSVSFIYDPECLEFVSEDLAAGKAGIVNLEGVLDTEAKEVQADLTFKVLKAGEHSIGVSEAKVVTVDEVLLTMSSQEAVIKGVQNIDQPQDETVGDAGSSTDGTGTPENIPSTDGTGTLGNTPSTPSTDGTGGNTQPPVSQKGEEQGVGGSSSQTKPSSEQKASVTGEAKTKPRQDGQSKTKQRVDKNAEVPVTKDSNISGILGIIGVAGIASAVLIVMTVLVIGMVSARRKEEEDSAYKDE